LSCGATGTGGKGKEEAEGRGGNLLLRRQEGGRKGREGLATKPKKTSPMLTAGCTTGWVNYANERSQAALERSSQDAYDVTRLMRAARRLCGQ